MGNRKQKQPERIVPFNLRLPASLHARAAELAEADERSLSWFLRYCIRQEIERIEQQEAA